VGGDVGPLRPYRGALVDGDHSGDTVLDQGLDLSIADTGFSESGQDIPDGIVGDDRV